MRVRTRPIALLMLSVALLAFGASPAMAVGTNLVSNGDFESGNSGFGSGHNYIANTGPFTLGAPVTYAVGTSPKNYHSGWTAFGDHTTGTGKMMIVNGDDVAPPAVVWEQDVALPSCYEEQRFPLFAGKTWQVGEMIVNNTDDQICITYELSSTVAAAGWRLTETHLALGPNANAIPQTKTGNPIPGAFPYSRVYDPGVVSDTFCVDMDITGAPIVIAAHAVVNKPSTSHMEYGSFCVTSGPTSKLGDTVTQATPTWVHPAWNSNLRDAATNLPSDLYTYADWVWDSYYNPSPRNGDLVDLYHEFSVPDGATVTNAELSVAADNAFSWKLNTGAWTDVNLAGDWRSQTVFSYPTYVVDPNMTSWKKVYTYDVTGQVSALSNALYVTGVNAAWATDDPTVNPAGVLYRLCGDWEKEVSDNNAANDSAWAGTQAFRGKNWATYFTYTPRACDGDYLLEFYGSSSYADPVPGQLQVKVNGVVLGSTLALTSTANDWRKYSAVWDPGAATSAHITITNLRLEFSGNDFCIDDVSFVHQH